MKKRHFLFLVFLLILIFFLVKNPPSFTGFFAKNQTDNGSITVYFCPESNCSSIISKEISNAQNFVHCAFYDVNLPDVVSALKEKSKSIETKLVTDNDNPTNLSFAIADSRNGLMHNKFCVIDGHMVITGSFNPTFGGLDDENNVLIIESKTLASNYESEFSEFQNRIFGRGNRIAKPVLSINNITVENYFCPEDWCADKVLKTVATANKSVHFMIFSFTDNSIGDLFVQKHKEGVDVSGVLDSSQNKKSNYSEYPKLQSEGIDVSIFGTGKQLLHSKVIVVDSKIVITGSYNPTSNGDKVNDENIIIIYNEEIAKEYERKINELKNKI